MTSIRHLREATPNPEANPYGDASFSREQAFLACQPLSRPQNPNWTPTVYYDVEKFPATKSIDRVRRFYQKEFENKSYFLQAITVSDLRKYELSKYRQAEKILLKRCFVSDVEILKFTQGGDRTDTAFLAHNREALSFQLQNISNYCKGRWKIKITSRMRDRILSKLMGGTKEHPVPLVLHNNVFLPYQRHLEPVEVHFALNWPASRALNLVKENEGSFFYAENNDVRHQVQFERNNSEKIFHGADAKALLLWQNQVLAVLCKVAWRIHFLSSNALDKQEEAEDGDRTTAREMLNADPALTDIEDIVPAYDRAFGDLKDLEQEKIAEGDNGPGVGLATYSQSISFEQIIIAAMHGSNYLPNPWPNGIEEALDPIFDLFDLATWIGQLKRRRHAELSRKIACSFLSVLSNQDRDPEFPWIPSPSEYSSIISDRLSKEALAQIIASIGTNPNDLAEPIPVVYEWTRSIENPWAAEKSEDGILVITGPLLDFPISQTNYWNSKSADLELLVT